MARESPLNVPLVPLPDDSEWGGECRGRKKKTRGCSRDGVWQEGAPLLLVAPPLTHPYAHTQHSPPAIHRRPPPPARPPADALVPRHAGR